MLPVTPKGFSIETPVGAAYRNFRWIRDGFTQKKPYNLLLPLDYTLRSCTLSLVAPQNDAVNSTGDTGPHRTKAFGLDVPDHSTYVSAYRNWALQDAKRRLASTIGSQGGLLVTLVEYKQAMQMMESRLLQLVRFTRHMARFEFGSAANAILSRHDRDGWERFHSDRRAGKFKRGSKNLASNYLELHYGWLPALGDISTAARLLSNREDLAGNAVAKASGSYKFVRTYTGNNRTSTHKGRYGFRAGCRFSISNPNLFLANQMGLVNPYVAVADVIKFSFLADYVFNISEFFSQFTDYAGLNVVDQWYSETLDDRVTWTDFAGGPVPPWPPAHSGGNRSFTMKRVIGALPTLKLTIRKPWQLSARRGSALASLLVQSLPNDPASLRTRRLVTRSERAKYKKLGQLGDEYFR